MNMVQIKSVLVGFTIGIVVSLAAGAGAQAISFVNTNGVLIGYTVQKNGETICSNPSVFLQFRGTESYIVCGDN